MIPLTKLQREFSWKLIFGKIKSIDNLLSYFDKEYLNKPIIGDKLNIIIYTKFNNAFNITREFRRLIDFLIENKYIGIKSNLSFPNFTPIVDVDTQVYSDKMQIFSELNELCEKYCQQNFIIYKKIRLIFYTLINRFPEKHKHKKLKLKDIFTITIITLIISVLKFGYTIISDIRNKNQTNNHIPENITIYLSNTQNDSVKVDSLKINMKKDHK